MFVRIASTAFKILAHILAVALIAAVLWLTCFFYQGSVFSESLSSGISASSTSSVTPSWASSDMPMSPVSLKATDADSNGGSANETTGMGATGAIYDELRDILVTGRSSGSDDASEGKMAKGDSVVTKHSTDAGICSLDGLTPPGEQPTLITGDIPLYTASCELVGKACGIPITFSSPVHDYSISDYDATLSVLPTSMLSALAGAGWSIRITDEPIESTFPFVEWTRDVEAVAGVCMVLTKEVWLVDDVSPDCLIHEFGHAIDWESGGASVTPEWSDAVGAARELSAENASDHATFDELTFGHVDTFTVCESVLARDRFFEQYATAFAYYWRAPMSLLEECPEIYAYFAERFGIWAGAGVSEEDCADLMESAHARGKDRRENPSGAPHVDDVGVAESRLRTLRDIFGDAAEEYADGAANGSMFAYIHMMQAFVEQQTEKYGA